MQKVNIVNIQNEYRTKDLAEASFLFAREMPLNRIEREGKVCWFIFENRTDCEQLAEAFWFGRATITAKIFYDAIQTLKNRIFSRI